MFILANELEKGGQFLESTGLYATLAAASAAVFVLAYLGRAVENYVRHLHGKPYLPYSQPRFVISTIGFILVADGFIMGVVFAQRVPLWLTSLTVSAGLLCLIVSAAMSIVQHMRQSARDRQGGGRAQRSR